MKPTALRARDHSLETCQLLRSF